MLIAPTATEPVTSELDFPGGLGRTTKPEEFESLFHDVTTKIFDVYGDTVVSPGHGKHTTLELERPSLPAGQERSW
ncbi:MULTISPECIES: hypothetical protein [Rhodococcus erythropolis group]|jgi:hypothetical protein|uniref:Beta-lactamase-like n=1 Tax=Rhodococcus erythropolis TaxID=1833 RepID=A0A6G9CUY4_RHOER|nr:Beta-lactamase-like [Rhodococcus erythropolis]